MNQDLRRFRTLDDVRSEFSIGDDRNAQMHLSEQESEESEAKKQHQRLSLRGKILLRHQ